jgi:hypothetical protein
MNKRSLVESPRGSGTNMAADGEVTIHEVEDATTAMRSVRKDVNARWVAGLTPHDDLPPFRDNEDGGNFAQFNASKRPPVSEPHWLRHECQLLVLGSLIILASEWWSTNPYLDFPLSETKALRLLDESTALQIAVNAGTQALFAWAVAFVALKLAKASQFLAAFIAFGCAGLAGVALLGDVVLLVGACQWKAECFLPFVLHWITVCLAWFSPCVAIVLLSYTLGAIPAIADKALWRRWLMILVTLSPLIILIAGVTVAVRSEEGGAQIAHDAAITAKRVVALVGLAFSWRLSVVPKFWAIETKPHQD